MSPHRRDRESATAEVCSLRRDLLTESAVENASIGQLGGRVLTAAVTADRDVPATAQSTMDGFAVDTNEESPREIQDDWRGPGDAGGDYRPGTAVRVGTGAPLPDGADAVLPVEDADVDGETLLTDEIAPGQHVIPQGSVVQAGETVLNAGRRLAPRDAVVLRELGIESVPVRARFSTAVLATGTEIHEGCEPDRDSPFLTNLLRAWGSDVMMAGSVPDDPDRVGSRIESLAAGHDVVVTTGGTGVSAADETRGVLRDRAEVRVEGVAMRPGSNASVAWLDAESTVVASLPGVPGAAFLSAILLLRPLFTGAVAFPTLSATMSRELTLPDRDLEFVVPVEWIDDAVATAAEGGGRSVVPFGHPDSSVELFEDTYRPHRVASCVRLSAADGFILRQSDVEAGEAVSVVPYSAVET